MAITKISNLVKNEARKCYSQKSNVWNKKGASLRIKGNDSAVSELHPHDVILCRGEGINKHFGNVLFRKVVAPLRNNFYNLDERKEVARQVVEGIKQLNPPGRFLMISPLDQSCLYEISDKKALTKVYQSLRDQRGCKERAWNNIDHPSISSKQQNSNNIDNPSIEYNVCSEDILHNDVVTSQTQSERRNLKNEALFPQMNNTIKRHVIMPISYIGQSFVENPAETSDESRRIFRMLEALPSQPESGMFHLIGIVGSLCRRVEELERTR